MRSHLPVRTVQLTDRTNKCARWLSNYQQSVVESDPHDMILIACVCAPRTTQFANMLLWDPHLSVLMWTLSPIHAHETNMGRQPFSDIGVLPSQWISTILLIDKKRSSDPNGVTLRLNLTLSSCCSLCFESNHACSWNDKAVVVQLHLFSQKD
jgi:hypothetical protein